MWLCVKRKNEWGKREKIILYIILLGSLYYFIGLYVKIRNEKLRVLLNALVKWIIKVAF